MDSQQELTDQCVFFFSPSPDTLSFPPPFPTVAYYFSVAWFFFLLLPASPSPSGCVWVRSINKLHRELSRERDEMEGQLLELANACRLFKADLESKATQLEEMQAKARREHDDLDMLHREAQEFKAKAQEQEVMLREQVDKLSQEVSSLREQSSGLRESVDSKEAALHACEEQLERAQAEIQILMAGKDGLSEEDRMKRLHSVGASLNKQRRGVGGSSTAAVGAGKVRVCASLPPSLRFAL